MPRGSFNFIAHTSQPSLKPAPLSRATLSVTSRVLLICASVATLSACAFAPGYTEKEQSIVNSLDSGLYQPASRETRDNIETQTLLSQAAFWGREHQLNPADLESAVRLSAAVRKLGNPSRAVEIAQTARALHPRDPYLTAEYAAALIASERGAEAVKPLRDGLRQTPQYARLWSLMGAAMDQAENYTEARKYYDRALSITPNDPNILANLGLSHALAGDAATAEVWLRRAAAMPEASDSVKQNLSLVLQLQGKDVDPALAPTPKAAQAPIPKGAPPNPYGAPTGYINDLSTTRRTDSFATRNDISPQMAPQSARQNQAAPHGRAPRPQGYNPAGAPQNPYRARQNNGAPNVASQQPAPQQGRDMGNQQMLTASDYARAAARQGQGRRVIVPEGAPAPTSTVLTKIARSVGPKSAGPQPLYPQGQQMGQAGQGQGIQPGANGYAPTRLPGYGAQNRLQSAPQTAPQYGQPQQPPYGQAQYQGRQQPAPRGAARRR